MRADGCIADAELGQPERSAPAECDARAVECRQPMSVGEHPEDPCRILDARQVNGLRAGAIDPVEMPNG
jgi:hypothetical protein